MVHFEFIYSMILRIVRQMEPYYSWKQMETISVTLDSCLSLFFCVYSWIHWRQFSNTLDSYLSISVCNFVLLWCLPLTVCFLVLKSQFIYNYTFYMTYFLSSSKHTFGYYICPQILKEVWISLFVENHTFGYNCIQVFNSDFLKVHALDFKNLIDDTMHVQERGLI